MPRRRRRQPQALAPAPHTHWQSRQPEDYTMRHRPMTPNAHMLAKMAATWPLMQVASKEDNFRILAMLRLLELEDTAALNDRDPAVTLRDPGKYRLRAEAIRKQYPEGSRALENDVTRTWAAQKLPEAQAKVQEPQEAWHALWSQRPALQHMPVDVSLVTSARMQLELGDKDTSLIEAKQRAEMAMMLVRYLEGLAHI